MRECVAHVLRLTKLMATWTGPWRVVGAHHPHVFEIQNIVSGRVQTAHVARLRFYADSQLNVTADIKDVFRHAFNEGQFEMAGIVRCLLYTSPSPRDQRGSRMPSSA